MQYSVHRFSISLSSVRHFPERSWTVVAFPCSQWSSLSRVGMPSYCCSSSDFLQSHYTVLPKSFLLPFSSRILQVQIVSFSVQYDSHHTSQERKPAAVPELPNDQPNQSPKQSHAEDLTEKIEATNGVILLLKIKLNRLKPRTE